jgi:4-amino-4-deoxy-L-arabinose transferase-like glycosyltransferase
MNIFTAPIRPSDFPNRLASLEPIDRIYKTNWAAIFVLVFIALSARLFFLLTVGAICPDGPLYLKAGHLLATGNWEAAFSSWKWNPLVILLGVAEYLGADPLWVGRCWNVLIASLAVLPLYGWIRRQYDERIAIVAALVYAVQASLLQWSHELMRDPTFWFALFLAVYCIWRAIEAVQIRWFVASGFTVFFAMIARKEGIFLLLPLVAWPAYRFYKLRTGKGRLTIGFILAATIVAVLCLSHSLTPPRNRSFVSQSRQDCKRVGNHLKQLVLSSKKVDAATKDLSSDEKKPSPRFGPLADEFINWGVTLVRSLTPLPGLLLLAGIIWFRTLWRRIDHQPLFWVAFLIAFVAFTPRVHVRYLLPVLLFGLPFIAMAIIKTVSWLDGKIKDKTDWSDRTVSRMMMTLVALLLFSCFAESTIKLNDYRDRQFWADWLSSVREEYGPNLTFMAYEPITRFAQYYAKSGSSFPVVRNHAYARSEKVLAEKRPDILILRDRDFGNDWKKILSKSRSYGYRQLSPIDEIPQRSKYAIFVSKNISKRPESVRQK